MYDEYEAKIIRLAEIKTKIMRFKWLYLIIIILSAIATITCLALKGVVIEPLMVDETQENKDLDFMQRLNLNSLSIHNGYVEESLKNTKPLDHYQFIRNGYYTTDTDSTSDKLVFNRTCGLKSSFKL